MNIAVVLLPVGLMTAGGILTGKDPDDKGPDDAIGQICIALAPVVGDLAGKSNTNSVLKAMRAIESVARAYRVQVQDLKE